MAPQHTAARSPLTADPARCVYDDTSQYLQQAVLQLVQKRLPLIVQVVQVIRLSNCRCCLHARVHGLDRYYLESCIVEVSAM